MAAGAVSLRYFILGLLARQSMSGYDIQRFLKSLGWLIGSPSSGSLYPILRALTEEGLATMEVIPGVDKPPKKTYTITEAGHQELQEWVDQPTGPKVPLKAFLMRLLLAGSFAPGRLLTHLEQRRSHVAAHHDALQRVVGDLKDGDDVGQYLAMEYGLALATAELDWLDHMVSTLSDQPLPQEDRLSGRITPALQGEVC
jgi:DNA-binding PadR family transcriptional regulator